jgi:hypothetical protein
MGMALATAEHISVMATIAAACMQPERKNLLM